MEPDERYMWMALDLARQGRGKTNPNPMVGAVLVKGGEVIGTGFHQKAGEAHAEIIALQEAGDRVKGATLYTNLEPCSHFGRTPPCTEALITAGIRKVVVAVEDPNPLVVGTGLNKLREAGIKIKTGVLEEKARRLNEVFFKYITTKTPFLAVKVAMTFDGKIATKGGHSRWISGEKSRRFVHRLRSMSDAIMVGINTVLQDDPMLTVRLEGEEEKNPLRVIVDSRGRLPLQSKIAATAGSIKTLLATTESAQVEDLKRIRELGVEVLTLPLEDGRVNLQELMLELGSREISALMVEGGGTLNYSLLQNHLIDKLYLFVAPLLFGGEQALTPFEGSGVENPSLAWVVKDFEMKQLDNDLLVIGYPVKEEK